MRTIKITVRKFQKKLSDYAHKAHVTVPVSIHGEIEWRTVLHDAMVYNPYGLHIKQVGMSDNDSNARTAMKFIMTEAKIYSNAFSHITAHYKIIN